VLVRAKEEESIRMERIAEEEAREKMEQTNLKE
jgi:Leucine-rich repeat (LRR) protein